jgi:hypothetical protein
MLCAKRQELPMLAVQRSGLYVGDDRDFERTSDECDGRRNYRQSPCFDVHGDILQVSRIVAPEPEKPIIRDRSGSTYVSCCVSGMRLTVSTRQGA